MNWTKKIYPVVFWSCICSASLPLFALTNENIETSFATETFPSTEMKPSTETLSSTEAVSSRAAKAASEIKATEIKSAAEKRTTQIIIPHTVSTNINHEDYYFTHLLKLVFSKNEKTFGPVEFVESPDWKRDNRLKAELKNNQLDLLWSPTTKELEEEFIPIKISLLRDLNDYHLLLIRPESQDDFSKVKTLKDLRQFTAGMSSQWADLRILQANDLPLFTAVGYGKFFKMLAAKRFDYFPRGIYQIESEVNFYPNLNLAIEKDLMLYYRNDVYFFVNKNKPELAKRLRLGLEAAIADGSFDKLLGDIPRYRWAMEELKLNHRRLIELRVP